MINPWLLSLIFSQSLSFISFFSICCHIPRFLKRNFWPSLGAIERFSGDHEQRLSLGSFAEAFISIAKPKCYDIKYSPVKLKFVQWKCSLYEICSLDLNLSNGSVARSNLDRVHYLVSFVGKALENE